MLIMTNLIMTFAIHAIFYSSHHDSSSCIHIYMIIYVYIGLSWAQNMASRKLLFTKNDSQWRDEHPEIPQARHNVV